MPCWAAVPEKYASTGRQGEHFVEVAVFSEVGSIEEGRDSSCISPALCFRGRV
jgi:hypothetical protein